MSYLTDMNPCDIHFIHGWSREELQRGGSSCGSTTTTAAAFHENNAKKDDDASHTVTVQTPLIGSERRIQMNLQSNIMNE